MKKLNEYFKMQEEIYDYFGYTEDWRVIPLNDCTDYKWQLFLTYPQSETSPGVVIFFEPGKTKEDVLNGKFYSSYIFTYCHLKKWVYRKQDYTMICVDTQTDGNKFLSIFDNKKEVDYFSEEELEDWIII